MRSNRRQFLVKATGIGACSMACWTPAVLAGDDKKEKKSKD